MNLYYIHSTPGFVVIRKHSREVSGADFAIPPVLSRGEPTLQELGQADVSWPRNSPVPAQLLMFHSWVEPGWPLEHPGIAKCPWWWEGSRIKWALFPTQTTLWFWDSLYLYIYALPIYEDMPLACPAPHFLPSLLYNIFQRIFSIALPLPAILAALSWPSWQGKGIFKAQLPLFVHSLFVSESAWGSFNRWDVSTLRGHAKSPLFFSSTVSW